MKAPRSAAARGDAAGSCTAMLEMPSSSASQWPSSRCSRAAPRAGAAARVLALHRRAIHTRRRWRGRSARSAATSAGARRAGRARRRAAPRRASGARPASTRASAGRRVVAEVERARGAGRRCRAVRRRGFGGGVHRLSPHSAHPACGPGRGSCSSAIARCSATRRSRAAPRRPSPGRSSSAGPSRAARPRAGCRVAHEREVGLEARRAGRGRRVGAELGVVRAEAR